jgi:hypothetical protein
MQKEEDGMNPAIKEVIEKYVWACKGKHKAQAGTNNLHLIARELGVSLDAASELVQSWLDREFA